MTARIAVAVLVVCLSTAACSSQGDSANAGTSGCPKEGESLETTMLYIEHNATDGDTGVHGNIGGEAWTELCLWSPEGTLLMDVRPDGPLGNLGVADLFFESREPENGEISIDELLSNFPEGEYLVGVVGEDGTSRVNHATFTHTIPAEPEISAPALAGDEESAGDAVAEMADLVVSWEPVTRSLTDGPIDITGYEVIVTKVDHDDPNGFSQPVFDVHLGPGSSEIHVPQEFLEGATLYELEVLALEVSGNQTISLGYFVTP